MHISATKIFTERTTISKQISKKLQPRIKIPRDAPAFKSYNTLGGKKLPQAATDSLLDKITPIHYAKTFDIFKHWYFYPKAK